MELDLDFVRAQFPAFAAEETRDWAFFENAGGSYVPATVSDRLQRFFVDHKVQPYGAFALSKQAGEEMDESYAAIASLINAAEDEITIGPSTTLNFYVLAQSLRHLLRVGDEIVVTNQDHEANIGCWRRLSEHGIVIREWRVGKADGELDLNDLDALITDKTRIVCATLCSNIVGTHNDMAEIVEMAHRVGALVVADGVSYAPHVIPDVKTLGVDFYAYSTYKTFGTHQGVLWGSSEALKKTEGQGHFFNEEKSRYRLNPTGPQHAQIAALAGITEYFDQLHQHHFGESALSLHQRARQTFDLVGEHEAKLANILLDYLKDREGIRILGRITLFLANGHQPLRFMPGRCLQITSQNNFPTAKSGWVRATFTHCGVLRHWGWIRQTVSCGSAWFTTTRRLKSLNWSKRSIRFCRDINFICAIRSWN